MDKDISFEQASLAGFKGTQADYEMNGGKQAWAQQMSMNKPMGLTQGNTGSAGSGLGYNPMGASNSVTGNMYMQDGNMYKTGDIFDSMASTQDVGSMFDTMNATEQKGFQDSIMGMSTDEQAKWSSGLTADAGNGLGFDMSFGDAIDLGKLWMANKSRKSANKYNNAQMVDMKEKTAVLKDKWATDKAFREGTGMYAAPKHIVSLK